MKQEIFERQLAFQKLIKNPHVFLTDHDKIAACNVQVRRAIDELQEALREMPYDLSGYTKTKKQLNISVDRIQEELADAQLFIVNVLNILGMTADDFDNICIMKQQVNMNRFETKKRFRLNKDNYIIVIEGVDGVGKSSICELLSDYTGHPIMRMPEPPLGDIEKFSLFYRKTVANIQDVMILDRFFPSSIVYGDYFKRDVPLTDLKSLSNDRNIFTFIIDRDEPYRGDDFINEEQWPEIRELYLSHAKTNKWKVIKNDSTLEACVMKIIAELQS